MPQLIVYNFFLFLRFFLLFQILNLLHQTLIYHFHNPSLPSRSEVYLIAVSLFVSLLFSSMLGIP